MKQYYSLIILFSFVINSLNGQVPENLVPNPSFEECTVQNYSLPFCNPHLFIDANRSVSVASWTGMQTGNTPEWRSFSSDNLWNSVCIVCYPFNIDTAFTNPFLDDKYIFIGKDAYTPSGEFVRAELISPLQNGKTYKIRIIGQGRLSALQSNYTPTAIDIHLTKSGEKWNENVDDNMMGAMFASYNEYSCKPLSYEHIFTATKDDLRHIIIQSYAGFFAIDRIELYEYCTEYLIRQNRTYKFFRELEEAGTIVAGSVINNQAMGDVDLLNGSVTIYKASKEVNLKEGFNVERGADFHAKIAECGKDCISPNVELPLKHVYCDNNCIQIGVEPTRGLQYSWSASNINYLDYLSSRTSSNPTLCIPQGVYGSFNFILSISNECGETIQKTITVVAPENKTPNFNVANSNLSEMPVMPKIDLALALNTEIVIIDILNCAGNIVYTKTYTDKADLPLPQNIEWQLEQYFSACDCYKIRIRTKNYCNENYKEVILPWSRPRALSGFSLPTIATCINGQRYLCFGGDGISNLHIMVYNRWGDLVFESNETPNAAPYCIQIPKGGKLTSGTYYMTIKARDCDGNVTTTETSVYLPDCSDGIQDQPIGETDNLFFNTDGIPDSLYAVISPNPINTDSKIRLHLPFKANVKLSILNKNFENRLILLDSKEFNSGDYEYSLDECYVSLQTGIYYCMIEIVSDETIRIVKKFSVVK